VYFRERDQQLGYTHPTELYRVDGLMGFKDHKGRKAVIEMAADTMQYGAVSKGWKEAMASGPVLILDGEVKENDAVVLFSHVGSLNMGAYGNLAEYIAPFNAQNYFTGSMIGANTMIVYENGTVYITGLVPEPTTATLSLLALAGLAARRRRK
jgi:hypothetical protein